MGFRINTNIPAMQGTHNLQKVARATEESSVKLSSGERITKAADDAAGLAISEKLKAEIRSSRQANRNANDGISLVQVAEGGLNESSNILTRMRELAMQSANDTLTDVDRNMAEMEYQQIKSELDRISKSTEFNGRKVLDGSGPRLDFQVGVGTNSVDDVISLNLKNTNSGAQSLGVDQLSIASKGSAQNSLSTIDRALEKIVAQRSQLGSIQNRLQNGSANLDIYTENMSAANNRIRDLDYADETAKQAKNSIIATASTAVQVQANALGANAVKLLS